MTWLHSAYCVILAGKNLEYEVIVIMYFGYSMRL